MRKKALIVAGLLAGLFLLSHLLPAPAADTPPVAGVVEAPEEVMAILHRSCWDCHSNETVWPWYSHVTPTRWFVRGHVHEGREHLNFTTWDQYSPEDRAHAFEEVVEVMEEAEMPLDSYLRLHPDARLGDAERRALMEWARTREAEEEPRGEG